MRIFLVIFSVAEVFVCGWILLQSPIMKIRTDQSLNTIETHYLRSDLTTEEKSSFLFFKDWILSNQQITSEMLGNVKVAGIALGATLLFQNLVLFSMLNKERQQPSKPGMVKPRTPSD